MENRSCVDVAVLPLVQGRASRICTRKTSHLTSRNADTKPRGFVFGQSLSFCVIQQSAHPLIHLEVLLVLLRRGQCLVKVVDDLFVTRFDVFVHVGWRRHASWRADTCDVAKRRFWRGGCVRSRANDPGPALRRSTATHALATTESQKKRSACAVPMPFVGVGVVPRTKLNDGLNRDAVHVHPYVISWQHTKKETEQSPVVDPRWLGSMSTLDQSFSTTLTLVNLRQKLLLDDIELLSDRRLPSPDFRQINIVVLR